MNSIRIDIPMNVAPSGLPRCLSLWTLCVCASVETSDEFWFEVSDLKLELRRNSWVIAIPMEAKERLVRSQARNVRSTRD